MDDHASGGALHRAVASGGGADPTLLQGVVLGSEPTLPNARPLGAEQTLVDDADTANGPSADRQAAAPPRTGSFTGSSRGGGTSLAMDDAWHLQGRKGPHTGQGWGDFQIGGILGEGGMGAVYRAKQVSLKRRVALKVLPPALADDLRMRERFLLEARVSSIIQSPHVVQVYAIGQHGSAWYYAMEFVEGTDLNEIIKGRTAYGRQLTPDEALDYVLQAARGLATAAQHGIVHRDIKPANLMVTRQGNLLKIADFGIVKVIGEHHLTMTGQAVGTPAYVSPEQGRGDREIDQRSDLYSLGVVFYELLTASRPFAAATPSALIYQHCYDEPELPRKRNPAIDDSVQAVVLKLLQKKPENRYQSAEELVRDLEAIKAGSLLESALARFKGTGADEARRANMNWLQRHLLPVALAAGLLVLGGGALAWRQLDQRNEARDRRNLLAKPLEALDAAVTPPAQADALFAAFAAVAEGGDERVGRWRDKLAGIATLRARLHLPGGLTPAQRAAADRDLKALAALVGAQDAQVQEAQAVLATAQAAEQDARRQLDGIDRASRFTVPLRQQAQQCCERLAALAGSDDRQVRDWRDRIERLDERVRRLVASLAPLDAAQAIDAATRAACSLALGEASLVLAEDDARLGRWRARLTGSEEDVKALRASLVAAYAGTDLPSLDVADRTAEDRQRFARLVAGDDADLRRINERLDFAERSRHELATRLAAIDQARAEVPPTVEMLAAWRRDCERYARLTRSGDQDLARWNGALRVAGETLEARRARCARLADAKPISLADQQRLAPDVAAVAVAGAVDAGQRIAWEQRLTRERERVEAERTALAMLDRPATVTPVLRAVLDQYGRDVGEQDEAVRRWRDKCTRIDELVGKLTPAANADIPLPGTCAASTQALATEVGQDDPLVVALRDRLAEAEALDRELAVLDRVATVPANADERIARSRQLFGEGDARHRARAAKLAAIRSLQGRLARAVTVPALPAQAFAGARQDVDALAKLVGGEDPDLQRWAGRLAELAGPGRPAWAADAGRDAHGAWASIALGGRSLRFRWCPPGTVALGSPDGEAGRGRDEVQVPIQLTRGFWLGEHECIQASYAVLTGLQPSFFPGDLRPVERVSWEDARACCAALTTRIPTLVARLPSEAEWEYACRAGSTTPWSAPRPEDATADKVGWSASTSGLRTHEAGERYPNALGLYDLHGNVWEWCADSYGPYPTSATSDWLSRGGLTRVVRGGSWADPVEATRAARRQEAEPGLRSRFVGFRIAIDESWSAPAGATLLAVDHADRKGL